MVNNTTKKEVVAISDDLINQAIATIESTEPTPEEREAEQLARLVPSIRMAMDRGESHDKIRKKVKSVIPTLHYKKMNTLLAAAAQLRTAPTTESQLGTTHRPVNILENNLGSAGDHVHPPHSEVTS